MTRRAGVLGHPISHSLSPVLHRAAYQALELDWEYNAYDVDSGGLAAFLTGVDRDWAGLSLTMPLKVEALASMDFIEPLAKTLGVINTVLVGGRDSTLQLVGANTDVYGVVTALAEAGVTRVGAGLVLGGGATAISTVAALGQLGCTRPTVAVRSRARAGSLLRACTAMGIAPTFIDLSKPEHVSAAFESCDVVVSTIPADAGEALAHSVGEATIASQVTLLDVVYSPLVTPLALAWRTWGGSHVGGERMLLHQASEQVRLMTGLPAPVAAMDAALAGVLPSS
jgi:shikimate dehydrogenase